MSVLIRGISGLPSPEYLLTGTEEESRRNYVHVEGERWGMEKVYWEVAHGNSLKGRMNLLAGSVSVMSVDCFKFPNKRFFPSLCT